MIEESIARRYARALIELAREENKVEVFATQLNSFYQLCRENGMLLDTLTNRFFDIGARLRIVDRLAEKLDLSPSVGNFLKILIKKGRMGLVKEIVAAYQRTVYELQNKCVATVISASKLDEKAALQIQSIIAKKTGKEVVLEKVVKPEVLGGVCVQIGGEVYDGTIKAELEKLSERMREAQF